MTEHHFDVLIVGAGLSGIGAAYHVQTMCPGMRYAILEAREELGGTWDLFRYPGIRSDSDMYTLGFSFRPWTNPKAIADGPAILSYLKETAAEYGIDEHIQYEMKVEAVRWSTPEAKWRVQVRRSDGEVVNMSCRFVFVCAGYYRYDAGHTPEFPGVERFGGRIIHPQHWPEDLDYAGKRVVVIGSGATAMTLVPELAKKAANVVMLQRSPTYVVSAPSEDKFAHWLRERLSASSAYAITRWKNALRGLLFFNLFRRFPDRSKQFLMGMVKKELGPDYDVGTHFNPRYKPWDQRLCLVPEGDLFQSIRNGDVSVVTDHIASFTEEGIALRGGDVLEADVVITATGLELQFLGGATMEVDGKEPQPETTMTYKGMMLSGVPNLMFAVGYTNASWTLKVDLTCVYACRLLARLRDEGFAYCVPRYDPAVPEEPLLDFTSGYIQRALHLFPRGGSKKPWKLHQNYLFDTLALRFARLDDGTMDFVFPSRDAVSNDAWSDAVPTPLNQR